MQYFRKKKFFFEGLEQKFTFLSEGMRNIFFSVNKSLKKFSKNWEIYIFFLDKFFGNQSWHTLWPKKCDNSFTGAKVLDWFHQTRQKYPYIVWTWFLPRFLPIWLQICGKNQFLPFSSGKNQFLPLSKHVNTGWNGSCHF